MAKCFVLKYIKVNMEMTIWKDMKGTISRPPWLLSNVLALMTKLSHLLHQEFNFLVFLSETLVCRRQLTAGPRQSRIFRGQRNDIGRWMKHEEADISESYFQPKNVVPSLAYAFGFRECRWNFLFLKCAKWWYLLSLKMLCCAKMAPPRKPNHQPPLSPGCLNHSHYVAGMERSVTEMDGCEWKDKMMSCSGSVTFKTCLEEYVNMTGNENCLKNSQTLKEIQDCDEGNPLFCLRVTRKGDADYFFNCVLIPLPPLLERDTASLRLTSWQLAPEMND